MNATLRLNQQVGVFVLAASLAPSLVVDEAFSVEVAQLASRRRQRERAALRARRQAQSNLVQLRHQLDPSERNARRVQDVISLLQEYGGVA